MSENALKRIKIVMARDGLTFDPSLRLSAGTIKRRLAHHFPNHHYNLMTVKLFLTRLYERRAVMMVGHKDLPLFSLTKLGFHQAQEIDWAERDTLGYLEPAAPLVAVQSKECLPAPI